jgi:hypothetical protein
LLTSTPWEETVAAQIDQVLPNPEEWRAGGGVLSAHHSFRRGSLGNRRKSRCVTPQKAGEWKMPPWWGHILKSRIRKITFISFLQCLSIRMLISDVHRRNVTL